MASEIAETSTKAKGSRCCDMQITQRKKPEDGKCFLKLIFAGGWWWSGRNRQRSKSQLSSISLGGRALKTTDNNQITMTRTAASDMKKEKLLFLVFEQVEHSQRLYGSIINCVF